MKANVSYPFSSCVSTSSLFAVAVLSIAQISVSIGIDCGSSIEIFAVGVLQIVISFFFLIFRCWNISVFQRSTVLIHSVQISLLIGWMMGYHYVCRSNKMDILVAFSIIIAVSLFCSDVFICFKTIRYNNQGRNESNPSFISSLTFPPNKTLVYDDNDLAKPNKSTNLPSIVPLSFQISSPAEKIKSMNVATVDSSSTPANNSTSPLLRTAFVSSGLASAFGSMMHLHSLSGEYNFSKARGQDELGEDIELGFSQTETYINNSSSWSVSRSMSMSEPENNSKKKKRRIRRTIILDGFRVNLKLTLMSNNGNDYIKTDSGRTFRNDLSMSMFRQLEHLLESSSCDIYSAIWDEESMGQNPSRQYSPSSSTISSPSRSHNGLLHSPSHSKSYRAIPVIIKMIRADRTGSAVAVSEFDTEEQLLFSMTHPNIVQLLGSGKYPRKFLVLELLEGGTLSQALLGSSATSRSTILCCNKTKRRRFSLLETFRLAHDLAKALSYLHNQWDEHVHIIHRDIKPDNIGWTADGVLKLFDFGLCAAVRARRDNTEQYKLTGNTGTLRYMAPEVVLGRSYHQSVDVYSFGILVWQVATGKTPFREMGKKSFVDKVIIGGQRLKLNPTWPAAFRDLLQRCWHEDKNNRPNMTEVEEILGDLLQREQLLSEARENSVLQRIKRVVLCKDEDLGTEIGRKSRAFRCMCIRLLTSSVSIAMLIASFSITFASPQPVSNSSVTSASQEHSREAITLAVIAVVGLYACVFSLCQVWPIIPSELSDDAPAELHRITPVQTQLNIDNSGMMVNPISDQAENIEISETVEGGMGMSCNARLEFFDTINMDDSNGKGNGNLTTGSPDRIITGSYSKSGENYSLNNNGANNSNNNFNDVSGVILFPSLHRNAKRGSQTPPPKSTATATSIGGSGESGVHYNTDEFAPSFNPMMHPTFV